MCGSKENGQRRSGEGLSDHECRTLEPKPLRLYHRQHTWANLQLVLRPPIPLVIQFGGGGGIGWIRTIGVADRTTSHGFHEFVQLAVQPFGQSSLLLLGVRVEQQQLWQPAKFGGIDHATTVKFVLAAIAEH